VADAVVDFLRPLQERYDELAKDPVEVDRQLAHGAVKAHAIADGVVQRVREATGLLPRLS
jgi:tryptophanyl-tRNA synthetase